MTGWGSGCAGGVGARGRWAEGALRASLGPLALGLLLVLAPAAQARVACGEGRGLGPVARAQGVAAVPQPQASPVVRPGGPAGPPGARPHPSRPTPGRSAPPQAQGGQAAQALWPRHPRARRVAHRLGGERVGIWLSPDKPEAVLAYYQRVLGAAGWRVDAEAVVLAREGLSQGEPAWLAFERPGMGKLELTVVQARDPQTGRLGTMFYQEAKLKP